MSPRFPPTAHRSRSSPALSSLRPASGRSLSRASAIPRPRICPRVIWMRSNAIRTPTGSAGNSSPQANHSPTSRAACLLRCKIRTGRRFQGQCVKHHPIPIRSRQSLRALPGLPSGRALYGCEMLRGRSLGAAPRPPLRPGRLEKFFFPRSSGMSKRGFSMTTAWTTPMSGLAARHSI